MEAFHRDGSIDVLIVEDEIDICYLLSGILRKQHLESSFATSLFAAQKAFKVHHPDVLFIDNHLPDGYGLDFIQVVKRESPRTIIVMMTAHDTGADEERAMKHGADYFMGKPFTLAMVINTLHAVLNGKSR
ncbi:MAG: response regulator [Ginsengibacter sp.]